MKSRRRFSIRYIAAVFVVGFSLLISAILFAASKQTSAQCLLQAQGFDPPKPEYAIDLGSGAKVVYKAPFFLTWRGESPDGIYTVYEKAPNQTDSSTKSLIIKNNTTQEVREITNIDKAVRFLNPIWSPDGRYFAVQGISISLGQIIGLLVFANRDGTNSHTFSADARQLDIVWSDDSAYVAYNDTNSLDILSIAGFQVTKIPDDSASSFQIIQGWLPHTHKIVYYPEMFTQQNFANLYVYNADKRSTATLSFADQPQSWFSTSFSPDGRYLAITRTTGQSPDLWDIFDVSANSRYFTDLGSVTIKDYGQYWWTLDSHAFIYLYDKQSPLMVYSLQNNQKKSVIQDNIGVPQLSPDRKKLLIQRNQPSNQVSLNIFSLEDNQLHELESGLTNWNRNSGALPIIWLDDETIITIKQNNTTFDVDKLNIETKKAASLAKNLPSIPYVVRGWDKSKIFIIWYVAAGQGFGIYDIPSNETTFYHADTTYPNTDITYFLAIPSPDKHFVALFFRELGNFSLQIASTDRPLPTLLYRGKYSSGFGSVFWLADSSSLLFSIFGGPTKLVRNDGVELATYAQNNPPIGKIGWYSCSDYMPQF